MAVKLRQPRRKFHAANAVALVVASVLAAPVVAAPERGLLCDASAAPALAISESEFTATTVSNSDELLADHLLKPGAKAAVRSAFASEASGDDKEIDEAESEAREAVLSEPGVQSAAEQRKRPVYRRQMYRRDI